MMKPMQFIVVCAALLVFPLTTFAEAEAEEDVTPIEECELDDYGEICTSNGLYGTCSEQGPNGCNGENPDYPGDCRGYPYCWIGNCGTEGEPGDSCFIDDFAGDCRLRCDMLDEDCEDDERTVCDISSALDPDSGDESGSESNGGCATTGQQAPAGFLLVGVLLAGLVGTRRLA